MGDATGELSAETAKATWKIDALWEWRHEVDTKIRYVLDKVMGFLHMKSERGPTDYLDEGDKIVRITRREIREMLRASVLIAQNGKGGNGSINGANRIVTTLLVVNTALLVGVGTWVVTTVQRHDKEIAVIQDREARRGR